MDAALSAGRLAPRGWFGIFLVAVCWPLNWALPGVRTAYLFFPLWLGYILIVDVLVEKRRGDSIWTRSPANFGWLFVLSTPAWWLFEVLNWRLGNWQYLGGDRFTAIEYRILSTISFSTVMPAVFETAELLRTSRWIERFSTGPRIPNSNGVCVGLFLAGIAMLSTMLLWPRYFYPFAWVSLLFILEPLNHWLGRPRFLERLRDGDWRKVIALAAGALVCGVFWEMWNYYSFPKWIYHTPGAQFLHIFEMPLLGYGGYIPFGLELCAMKDFMCPRAPRLQL